jgi:hypothetical protein
MSPNSNDRVDAPTWYVCLVCISQSYASRRQGSCAEVARHDGGHDWMFFAKKELQQRDTAALVFS